MKKILIVIFLFPIIVKAETFYSDYKLTKSLDNLDKDLYKIELIKKYNTFNYIRKALGYLEENNHYIKDEKDYIEKTIESSNYDANKEQNIIIHTYDYETNFIYLSFKYQHFYLKIYEVEVYVNDKKINYTTNRDDAKNIMDNNYNTYFIPSLWFKSIGMLFEEKYNLNDIKLIIYASSTIDETISIDTMFGYKINLNKNNTKKYNIYFKFDNNYKVDYYYLSKEKLYKYYYLDKEILNKYEEYNSNINLILNDYIVEKKYYKRDKLVLKDKIIFKNKSDNIEDFIEYKTDNVSYTCDINKEINGNYLCEFKIGNKVYLKRVIVDIDDKEDNNSNILENENNSENNFESKFYQVENINYDKKITKKNIINNKKVVNNKKVNKETNTLNKKNINNNINNDNVIELNDNKNNYLKILIVLILISINIFLIKKSKVMSKDFKNKNK